jgi:nicotinamidase-related amidase
MRDRTPSVTACQHATATVFQRGMLLLAGAVLSILASTTLRMSQVAPGSQGPREKSINIRTDTRKTKPTILDPRTTAVVMIDLQNGVLGLSLLPHPAPKVLESASKLAGRFRHAGATVVWVRACWSPDLGDALRQPVDKPMALPADGFPAKLPEGLTEPSDLVITKRQWGAFYGTELDLQLRRRGVRTIVLGGVATNFGVESTARDAWERGYEIVIAEDVTSSLSAELHDFSMQHILPHIAVISSSAAISFKED